MFTKGGATVSEVQKAVIVLELKKKNYFPNRLTYIHMAEKATVTRIMSHDTYIPGSFLGSLFWREHDA